MHKKVKHSQVYRFDQMAVQVKDKVDPAEASVERYVGLEHIDPESLKIRRWGKPSDVESSKILFRSGDIIFGKRRAYQRKLAVADFDGICSAHAMVLRPKTDVVLEEFLPFFMQSDIFMDRAVKISVGGLSPTINWGDLAREEFVLPALEEQKLVVKVLLAAEATFETLKVSLGASACVWRSIGKQVFMVDREGKARTRVGEVADVMNGTTPSRSNDEYWGGTIPWLPTGKVNDRYIREAEEYITEKALEECSLGVVPAGATLIAMIGQGATRGRAALLEMDSTINQNFAAVVPKEDVLPHFLFYQLDTLYEALRNWSQGSNQLALNCQLVAEFPVWVPDVQSQRELCEQLDYCAKSHHELRKRAVKAGQFKEAALRSVFK